MNKEKELQTLKNAYLIAPNLYPEDEELYFQKQEKLFLNSNFCTLSAKTPTTAIQKDKYNE